MTFISSLPVTIITETLLLLLYPVASIPPVLSAVYHCHFFVLALGRPFVTGRVFHFILSRFCVSFYGHGNHIWNSIRFWRTQPTIASAGVTQHTYWETHRGWITGASSHFHLRASYSIQRDRTGRTRQESVPIRISVGSWRRRYYVASLASCFWVFFA